MSPLLFFQTRSGHPSHSKRSPLLISFYFPSIRTCMWMVVLRHDFGDCSAHIDLNLHPLYHIEGWMCIESSLWPNFVSLWTWIPTTLQCFLSMNTTLQNDFVDKRPLHQVMPYNYSSLSHPIVLLSYSCHCDPCWCAPSSPTLVFPFLQLHGLCINFMTLVWSCGPSWHWYLHDKRGAY